MQIEQIEWKMQYESEFITKCRIKKEICDLFRKEDWEAVAA